MALGATPGHVRRAFLCEGLALSAAGMALGGLAAAALARALAGQLPYVRPGDPVSFLVAAAVLAAVSALATLIPAARATHVDPLVALREE
jgi:ABC-type lipoprotein release transport system permease subunit